MHNKETQAAWSNQNESPEGVQRLELLMLRFSEAEIQSLSLLQLVHRPRPNALDQPVEECGLRFARWLGDNGRLSEHTACPPEEQKGQSEARGTAQPSSCPAHEPWQRAEGLPA